MQSPKHWDIKLDPAVKAQLEDTRCEAEGEGGVEDALDDACSPTLHTTLKMSALKPCPVHGTPQAHASSSQSTHRHTSTLSTHQKRVDEVGDLREPGSGRWQWWPQPRSAPILKRHLAGWLQQNYESSQTTLYCTGPKDG
ncbi:unnamed protein product [Arctogadus glacialis]